MDSIDIRGWHDILAPEHIVHGERVVYILCAVESIILPLGTTKFLTVDVSLRAVLVYRCGQSLQPFTVSGPQITVGACPCMHA